MTSVALLRKTDESEHSAVVRCNEPFDLPRLERALREILFAVGEDPDRDGLVETPQRVARAYAELLAGLRADPAPHLERMFEHRTENDLILVRDIEFSSLCEHHLLPFNGAAHVAYLPDKGRVVRLSKIARTVNVFARRLQLQERLTVDIADAISDHLKARGVAVVLRARSTCACGCVASPRVARTW